MKDLTKHLLEEYEEAFHTPDRSIHLLTKSESAFIKTLIRLNYFNELKDKKNDNERSRIN
tara:strand:+ start:317 stop:496 length:180 start_codon:yes stop_codon:yes gene_type:complete